MRNLLLAAFAVLFLASPAISQSAVDPSATTTVIPPPPVVAPAPVVTQTTTPTTVPAGSTVVVTAPTPVDTTVSVPIGSWINIAFELWGGALVTYIVVAFRAALSGLGPRANAIMLTMQADQLMTKALSYALNMAGTTTKDKVWTIDVRNKVLKDVVTYAIVHGSDVVKTFIGTPADMAEKGFARIAGPIDATGAQQPSPLPVGPKPDFAAIGAEAAAAANVEVIKRA